MKRMPKSVVEIDIEFLDGKPYFRRFFCAVGPCIEGFLEGCRPYLSIDSTALNGRSNGHLAAACSVDGHIGCTPLYMVLLTLKRKTIGFGSSHLHKAIGDLPLLVCTDACKGLENADKYAFPNVGQRECFRHLMKNYVLKYIGL